MQNGINPSRLLRLVISGDAIASVEVVDAAHPSFADPTLGVVAGESFYYIANSQWGAARPGGQMDLAVTPQNPQILMLSIGAGR